MMRNVCWMLALLVGAPVARAQDAPAEPSTPWPATPAEPAAPTEPPAPVEPAASTEPAAPAEPAASTEPAAPAEPAASTEPAEPGEPAASTEPAAPAEPLAPVEPPPDEVASERHGVAPYVGVQFGPTFPFNDLRAAVLPRLEVGVELPPLERRLRVFLAVAWARPPAKGSGTHVALDGGTWTYTLHQDELSFALGPTLRIPDLHLPVVPEVSQAPELYLLRSVTDGDAAGQAFGQQVETYTRVGIYAAVGAAMALGPGELTLHLSVASSGLDGVLTGKANTAAFAPTLGYRLIFQP